ncbi:MAG: hypothetical protein KKD44_11200 [Proteobacteria bacterium]|nr:hypothetical protein [Pseudomonadota bacterium]
MLKKIIKSLLYSGLITAIYFIASNGMYYFFNRQTMFADPYFYEWVEYLVVAGVLFVCVSIMECIRYFYFQKS